VTGLDSSFMPQRRSLTRAEQSRLLIVHPLTLWEMIDDPFQMPRWWPGVTRIEGVEDDRFTQVFQTKRRHTVRMDFRVLVSAAPGSGGEPSGHRAWEQEVQGTPFERVLDQSITEVLIDPAPGGTSQVTIVQLQKLRGYSRTGTLVMRRATNKRLDEALDGLAQLFA
jgi:Polyketide cyclase / dehydrase and lipid transport